MNIINGNICAELRSALDFWIFSKQTLIEFKQIYLNIMQIGSTGQSKWFYGFWFWWINIWYNRWKSGVASSLNYIKIDGKESSPAFIPYPSWQANTVESDGFSTAETTSDRKNAPKAVAGDGQLTDNSSIISTFRIAADECDRLWVMDTGLADILGNPKQIAEPALVIFDLNTDKLIKRYTIPATHIKSDTFFANVVRIIEFMNNWCINYSRFGSSFDLIWFDLISLNSDCWCSEEWLRRCFCLCSWFGCICDRCLLI